MTTFKSRLINFCLYQSGWFACVLGLAWGFQWTGISIALILVGVHFWLAMDRALQIKLTLFAAAWGLMIDSVQMWLGVFTFPDGKLVAWLPPPSITVLWLQFATTFRYCLHWLGGRYALSGLFGFLGAPLAFFAGERLGAIEFLAPRIPHFTVLAVLWLVSVPLLVLVSDRLGAGAGSDGEPRYSIGKRRDPGQLASIAEKD